MGGNPIAPAAVPPAEPPAPSGPEAPAAAPPAAPPAPGSPEDEPMATEADLEPPTPTDAAV